MALRDVLNRRLAGQLAHPHGLAGRVVARRLNKGNGAVVSAAVSALELREGQCAADIGFGGGIGLLLLLGAVGPTGTVQGVDLSSDMVARARRTHRAERLHLHQGSMTALPLAGASVDGLITVNTIYFVADLAAAFGELARVLAPGGRAVVGMAAPEWMAAQPVVEHGFRVRQVDEVVATMRAAGPELIEDRTITSPRRTFHLLVFC